MSSVESRLCRGLFVVEPRRIFLNTPSVRRLDPAANPRRWAARDFHHGLLARREANMRIELGEATEGKGKNKKTFWVLAITAPGVLEIWESWDL